MNHKKVLLASLLAASGVAATSAHAVVTNWIGTADYTQSANPIANADIVGPFDTYDEGVGVVLLQTTSTVGTTANLSGYYQSFIAQHTLAGSPVSAPSLEANNYELTVVATFTESADTSTGAINVNSGGTFGLYLGAKDRSFSADSGFDNGDLILQGIITGGTGTSINAGSMIFGVTDINITITGYDTNVYSPDTIASGGGIFTLRLGNPLDVPLLSQVTTVQGHSVAGAGNYLFAADGYTALAVPEAETYAMMIAGLGLVGFMARRRTQMFI
jgi:hypothetical protein